MPKKKVTLAVKEVYTTRDGSIGTIERKDGDQFIGTVELNPDIYEPKIASVITRWNDDGSNVYNTEFDIKG